MIPNGSGPEEQLRRFITLLKELVTEGKVPQIADRRRRPAHPARQGSHAPLRPSFLRSGAHLRSWLGRAPPSCPPVRAGVARAAEERKTHATAFETCKRLVLAGQAADDLGIQCGGWTITWQGKTGNVTRGGTTLLAAVRRAVGPNTVVAHSADGTGVGGADAVIVAIGERPYAEMRGDRRDLSLPKEDLSVLNAARAAGLPIVTVVYSGRPVLLGPVLQASDAVLAAWLPGTEGQGIADVILGDVKPTGKLPHTWPRSMDQIPCNLDDGTAKDPLFPYGFGLTY